MNVGKSVSGFLVRFTVTHVVTYTLVGIAFLWLLPYKEFLLQNTGLAWRPLDSPIVQAAPLFQILRGAFLALIIYPFRGVLVRVQGGWVKLFFLLWGLAVLGAVNAGSGSIEGLIYTQAPLSAHLLWIPEVTVQMALFSWLFVRWEGRKTQREVTPDPGRCRVASPSGDALR